MTEVFGYYCDLDWCEGKSDKNSTIGYVFLMGGALISWHCKESAMTLSSCEAKHIST